jgi:hypothetical protein
LEVLAVKLGFTAENYGAKFEELLGTGWGFKVVAIVDAIRLPVYPTLLHAQQDYPNFVGPEDVPPETIIDCVVNGGRDHKPSVQSAARTFFMNFAQHKTKMRPRK